MYMPGGLVETYALEMLKYAKDQRMTKQNLMNAKVVVTLVYKIGNENLEKNITGKTTCHIFNVFCYYIIWN